MQSPTFNPTALATLNSAIPAAAARATEHLGGYLRCESCGHERQLGNLTANYRDGWPRCCGYTMRWWTQRQIAAGEVPTFATP